MLTGISDFLADPVTETDSLALKAFLSPMNDLRVRARSSPKGRKVGRMRAPHEITGIVLHNTGRQDFRTPVEWLRHIGTNFFIPKSGIIQYCHDILELRPSTQKVADSTVAVEFIGNFRMTNGNWRKKGSHAGHHDMPSAAQIKAGWRLITYLRLRYQISYVYAHRQTWKAKPDDPGMDVWANVGEWAIKQLGMQEGRARSSGLAIPAEWKDASLRTVAF